MCNPSVEVQSGTCSHTHGARELWNRQQGSSPLDGDTGAALASLVLKQQVHLLRFTFPLVNSPVNMLLNQLLPCFVNSEDSGKILKKVELYKERGSPSMNVHNLLGHFGGISVSEILHSKWHELSFV